MSIRMRTRSHSFSYPWLRVLIGVLVVISIGVVAGGVGSVYIPPNAWLRIIADRIPFVELIPMWPASWETIIWELRMPRIVLAGVVGGGLAVSGATFQGLFRNPLADPYLIGVTSGAGLGATLVFLTGVPFYIGGFSVLPLAALVGGIGAVTGAYVIARQSSGLPLTTLILAGVAIASMTGALTSLLMIRADPDVRPLLGWLLGGFIGTDWQDVKMALLYTAPGVAVMVAYSRILNIFQLDEDDAKRLGVNVERSKMALVAMASLTTATAVSVSGMIVFVGLIAPHTVRLMWGYDYRTLMPMAIIVGAGFLILADLVARTVASPSELPVGVVTALCGAPFFLYFLWHRGYGVSA